MDDAEDGHFVETMMRKAMREMATNNELVRNAVIDECVKCVPTNWLDALLSGPDMPRANLNCRDVEQLLRGVQDRIRALKTSP